MNIGDIRLILGSSYLVVTLTLICYLVLILIILCSFNLFFFFKGYLEKIVLSYKTAVFTLGLRLVCWSYLVDFRFLSRLFLIFSLVFLGKDVTKCVLPCYKVKMFLIPCWLKPDLAQISIIKCNCLLVQPSSTGFKLFSLVLPSSE